MAEAKQEATKMLIPTATIPERSATHNLEAIEKQAKEIAAQYTGIVLDPENVPALKKDRAYLNGLKGQLSSMLTTARAKALEPYEALKKLVDPISAYLDTPIKEMDEQLKAFEEQLKANRAVIVSELIDEELYGASETLEKFVKSCPWHRNDRWTLGSYFTAKENPNQLLKNEVEATIRKATDGASSILNVGGEFTDTLLEDFRRDGDLAKALAKLQDLKDQQEMARQLKEDMAKDKEPEIDPFEEPVVVDTTIVVEPAAPVVHKAPPRAPGFAIPAFMPPPVRSAPEPIVEPHFDESDPFGVGAFDDDDLGPFEPMPTQMASGLAIVRVECERDRLAQLENLLGYHDFAYEVVG